MVHPVRRALRAALCATSCTALCIAVLGTIALHAGPAAAQSPPASSQAALLARGKVLMEGIVACGNCHVARGPQGEPLSDKGLSGGMVFDEPPFRAVASNITPDAATGIGRWTDAQLARAIREGVRPDGSVIGPPMPMEFYRHLADSDLAAIVAWLRAQPAVANAPGKSVYRMPLPPSYGPPITAPVVVPPASDKLRYGEYLARIGHCMDCHTPRSAEGRLLTAQLGAGGMRFPGPWGVSVARNLTPHESGLKDWTDAEISFSTQSSTESMQIPELDALVLGDTHTTTRILESKESSFVRAQRAFEGQNQLWNKVHHARSATTTDRFEEVYQSNLEYLQVVQSKTVQLFDSLGDRGTTAHFRALAAPSVRGDGHPVRMRIGGTTLKSRHEIVAVPEQSLNAARSLEMLNSSGQALLPGKVSLYQDGAFLGVTELDFIADGEDFSVFLSVADHVKLSRRLDRKQSTLSRGKRSKMQVRFLVTAENLSSEPTTFTLADRIPVSENRDITVSSVKVTDGIKPDRQGLLHWDVTLGPKERREFQVSYQVEYPSQLVLDAQRRLEYERMSSPAGASPAPKRKAKQIDEQLLDLENAFY